MNNTEKKTETVETATPVVDMKALGEAMRAKAFTIRTNLRAGLRKATCGNYIAS